MFVGRIAGITPSDVSSYLARDLFYNDILKNYNTLFVASGHPEFAIQNAIDWSNVFKNAGYISSSETNPNYFASFSGETWKDKY
jgi:hypothetical protein